MKVAETESKMSGAVQMMVIVRMQLRSHGTIPYGMLSGRGAITHNGIRLKADRLYKQLVCGGLILGCVMLVRWDVREAVLFY
jgi:hypothetical protein